MHSTRDGMRTTLEGDTINTEPLATVCQKVPTISQGSVATHFACGGIVTDDTITSLLSDGESMFNGVTLCYRNICLYVPHKSLSMERTQQIQLFFGTKASVQR